MVRFLFLKPWTIVWNCTCIDCGSNNWVLFYQFFPININLYTSWSTSGQFLVEELVLLELCISFVFSGKIHLWALGRRLTKVHIVTCFQNCSEFDIWKSFTKWREIKNNFSSVWVKSMFNSTLSAVQIWSVFPLMIINATKNVCVANSTFFVHSKLFFTSLCRN